MKKIFCYLKAIPFFLSSGVWCPHVYKEIGSKKGIVITTKNSFRISDNFLHNKNETVHPSAIIIRSRCTCCGCEELSWYDSEPLLIKN